MPDLLPGAEPFTADGVGRVGVLVSHGFTGTPQSMRPWAQHLADAGYHVRLPLLPGHGTSWQQMNKTGWRDWYGEVRRAYDDLARHCDQIFLCGLSMGGTLVTKLAADLAAEGDTRVGGLILVNAAYGTERRDAWLARYISWAVTSRPGIGSDIKLQVVREKGYDRTPLKAFVSLQDLWRTVVPQLGAITVPILYFHSTEDHVVEPLSGRLLHAGATATTVTEVPLTNSYHVATLDNDAEQIFTGSVEFIAEHTRVGEQP